MRFRVFDISKSLWNETFQFLAHSCSRYNINFKHSNANTKHYHFKWDDSPNDPPNNPPVLDDDNQQGNAQPAQNNAAQANDIRNVLRSDVYADVVKRFELEFVGEKRVVFARYRFWIYERTEEQHFDDYTTELHTLANACEFKEHESMIKDKIMFSMKDKVFRNVC